MRWLVLVLVTATAHADSRGQLAAALARPGARLFTPVHSDGALHCSALHVADHGLVYESYDGHAIAKSAWQLYWNPEDPDTIGIADPTYEAIVVDPDWPWAGGGFGTLCASDHAITYFHEHVEIGNQPLYFTLAGCRSALRRQPFVDHDTPSFDGGC
jgi:hypothetical protein